MCRAGQLREGIFIRFGESKYAEIGGFWWRNSGKLRRIFSDKRCIYAKYSI